VVMRVSDGDEDQDVGVEHIERCLPKAEEMTKR